MQISLTTLRALLQEYASYLIALGIFALCGASLGALQISSSAGVPEQTEQWSLPKLQAANLGSLSDDDIGARFWTEQPRAAKKKAEPAKKTTVAKWRFLGTIDQGSTLLAVIDTDGGKIRWAKNGDALPDGAIITQIADGALSIEREGNPLTLRLFVEKKPE